MPVAAPLTKNGPRGLTFPDPSKAARASKLGQNGPRGAGPAVRWSLLLWGGALGACMRPKFSVWSDYGAPAQKSWMSASKRGTRTSIGPMILLAAVVVVAGVIGISGIYPQI